MEEIDLAERIAREAGTILVEKLGKVEEVEFKGERDPVTEADRASERHIISAIHSFFPQDAILSEESRGREEVSRLMNYPGRTWIVDPLDGTTNFAHGLNLFAISIALRQSGRLLLGVVYDPTREEMFACELGSGAYLTSKRTGGPQRLRVSKTASLEHSLLATGFAYRFSRSKNNNLDHFQNFSLRTQAVRRLGSAALVMAYVAAGRLDGYWEYGLSPWDTAGAALMVSEAGGQISDFHGRSFDPFGYEVLATNSVIHDEMLRVLALGRTGMEQEPGHLLP